MTSHVPARAAAVGLQIAMLWRCFVLCLFILPLAGGAYAAAIPGPLAGQYFIVKSDPDFNQHTQTTLEVLPNLGDNRLPVILYSFDSDGQPVTIHDQTANGEITWWSPSLNPNVKPSTIPTGVVNMPFNLTMFAPAPGAGQGPSPNGLGFLTAHFTGTLLSADDKQKLFMFLGSDDDAFVYIDDVLVDQFGGVHPFALVPPVEFTLPVGIHTLDIFYADREPTGARLLFAICDTAVCALPSPEPATLALLGVGLAGLGFARQRKPN